MPFKPVKDLKLGDCVGSDPPEGPGRIVYVVVGGAQETPYGTVRATLLHADPDGHVPSEEAAGRTEAREWLNVDAHVHVRRPEYQRG